MVSELTKSNFVFHFSLWLDIDLTIVVDEIHYHICTRTHTSIARCSTLQSYVGFGINENSPPNVAALTFQLSVTCTYYSKALISVNLPHSLYTALSPLRIQFDFY